MKLSQMGIIRMVLLGVSVIALLFLAMTLSRLTMDPGVPFEQIWKFLVDQLKRDGITGPLYGTTEANDAVIAVLRTLFLIVLAALPFAVIMLVIDPEMRKRVFAALVRMVIIFGLLALFIERQSELEKETVEIESATQVGGELSEATSFTDEEFSAARISKWVVWMLSLLVGLVLAAIVVATVNRLRRSRGRSDDTWAELADQAQAAIREIREGGGLRNSILRCYVEMNRIVREQRGVRRAATMTAREFKEFLVHANLPDGPVGRLTELFEKARYGIGDSTPQEESDAIASLQAIADACRSLA